MSQLYKHKITCNQGVDVVKVVIFFHMWQGEKREGGGVYYRVPLIPFTDRLLRAIRAVCIQKTYNITFNIEPVTSHSNYRITPNSWHWYKGVLSQVIAEVVLISWLLENMSLKMVSLTGGSPWGFRLVGGCDFRANLAISKVSLFSSLLLFYIDCTIYVCTIFSISI